jgi:hypothetical protein
LSASPVKPELSTAPSQLTSPCGFSVHEDERERPRGENPANGPAHAHNAEFFLRVLHGRKGDGICYGNGGDVEEAVDHHQRKEGPKRVDPSQGKNRKSANQMAEGEKFFRREGPVGELVAEEHAHDGGNGESVENPRLLTRRESKAGQIAKNQGKPSSPNEEFQHHHDEEFEAK